jgi:hypothetical protein
MRSATASRTLPPGSPATVRGTPSRANRWLAHGMVKPLVFVLACLPAAWLFWAAMNDQLGANPAEALIRSLGDWSLRFLVLVLTVTPLRELTGWSALARLRRMIGLFVFFYVCLHLLAYAWFDMGFELGEIVADHPAPGRKALAGFAPRGVRGGGAGGAALFLDAQRQERLRRSGGVRHPPGGVVGLAAVAALWTGGASLRGRCV